MTAAVEIEAAAQAIATAIRNGDQIPRLPEEIRPRDLDAAYRVQDRLAGFLGPVGGWKVGRSSADGLDTCAPLFQSRIFPSDVKCSPRTLLGTGVEIEFAFRIAADLPSRDRPYGLEEIKDAIDGFVPLVELVGGRFLERGSLGVPEQLADGYGAGVFVGEVLSDWRHIDFRALEAQLWIEGTKCQSAQDVHPAGYPLVLVVWLANHLAGRPTVGGLRRGQIVTTGGLAGVTPVHGGERVEARYRLGDGSLLAALRFNFDR